MKTTMRFTTALLTCFALALTTVASAANINWGDISDPNGDVTFVGVTEDNNEASTVFAPEATGPTAVGNMLIANPQGFSSQSNGGADLIDSQLSMMITADADAWLSKIRIEEFGDYTLGGLRGGEAFASVGASFFWSVDEVNNQAVSLPTQITMLDVNNNGYFERPDNDGTARPWIGNAVLDVQSLLDDYKITGSATKITLTFDNTLQTAADQVSNAFIKKKGVKITVDTHQPSVPEPTAAVLALVGVGLVAGRRSTRC